MENNDESIRGFISFCWENKFLFVVVMAMGIFVGMFAPNILGADHRIPELLSPLPETNSTLSMEAE